MNLMQGDCLERMKEIPSGAVDMILTDPPYRTTACKWDSIIPLEPMWCHLKRVIKPNGAVVLFGSEPFSSALRISNIKSYKYDWVWQKRGFQIHLWQKKQPLRSLENIMVFNNHNYNPQGLEKCTKILGGNKKGSKGLSTGTKRANYVQEFTNYPRNLLDISADNYGKNCFHPTQKPIALMEYLIKTYTNERETVLDFTMGSGTTGVACANLNRDFIGIEMDEGYFSIAKSRIEKATLGDLF